MIFKDRTQAGQLLAQRLQEYKDSDVIVVGLTRGGVEVAASLARGLNLPLSALIVKKIRSLQDSELAVGAVTEDNIMYIDWRLAHRLGMDEADIQKMVKPLKTEIKRQQKIFRNRHLSSRLEGRKVILTDDGIATGATVKVAIKWLKAKNVKEIILVAPVGPADLVKQCQSWADRVVVPHAPDAFGSVGTFYRDFREVADKRVVELLQHPLSVRRSDNTKSP